MDMILARLLGTLLLIVIASWTNGKAATWSVL
jgi:hypothetical protein